MIAGVDGFRERRWIAALDTVRGHTRLELIESFQTLLGRDELSLIVIDVPVGLLDAGERECDRAARKLIGKRRSSVFPAPIRAMLDAETHEEACQKRYRVEKKRCSIQSFSILPAIRDADNQLTPALQSRVREGHPEVSFTLLNDGSPMKHSKKSRAGRDERLALLARHFPDIQERVASISKIGAEIDAIDAYALLWTARRLREGISTSLPDTPQYDSRGLRAEIVA